MELRWGTQGASWASVIMHFFKKCKANKGKG